MNKRQKKKLENRLQMEYLRWYYPEIRSRLGLNTANALGQAVGICPYDPSVLCQYLDEDRPVIPRYRRSTMRRLVHKDMIRWINKLPKETNFVQMSVSTDCEAQFLDD